MARFNTAGRDTAQTYRTAADFRDHCLRADGSLLFTDASVWTLPNLDRLREKFVDAPDLSDRSFRDKFADQLKGEAQPVIRLAAELLAVYFLFPSNVSARRKRAVVGAVLGWSGDTLDENHAVCQAFAGGIGSGGQGYNTRRPDELAFLIRLAIAWKKLNKTEADQTAADPWRFQEFVDDIEDADSRQSRHMLLHLLFPDHFERIASRGHKWQVEHAFSSLLADPPEGRDQRLLAIRKTLEGLLTGQTLDFYWPPLSEAWYDTAGDIDVIHHKKQVVLYGPPGTSKTYRALRVAERIIRSAALRQWGGAEYFREQAKVSDAVKNNVHVVQLHPAFSYEDFVRGLHLSGSETVYRDGVLLQVLNAMNKEPTGKRLPHVLVLDEMNRTDLSRMLGECFSLLENRDRPVSLSGTDKHGRGLTLTLPSDLYVVGTMNLIDQSVEQIDFALRRRFLWIECPFDPDVLLQIVQEMWAKNPPPRHGWDRVEDDFRKLAAAASNLNHAVRESDLLGPQYEVGHTYFFDAAHFRSSVFATYSCYFPFYEDVVLRRLMAAGCTHNVLMVDATLCAEAFADNELRPRRAGRDYTLISVKVGGAFHPKMFLRFGKLKGSLHVGSHNLTLSGFGLNDEVTNVFRIEGSRVRSASGPFRQAVDYLKDFVPTGRPDVGEAFERLKLGVPWMDSPPGAGDPARVLLTAATNGPDLWSQIAPLIPGDVTTAFICGPFFDPALALVRRIQSEIGPQELVLGIDPASVEIDPVEAASLASVRWVNVAGIPPIPQRREGSSPYLHAKVFWFTGKGGSLLVTGSANPSVAAFSAPAPKRNAEAVVADRRSGAGSELGIDAFLGAPPITSADWTVVATRRATEPAPGAQPSRHMLLATPTPTGFRTHAALPLDLVLRGIGDVGTALGESVVQGPTAIDASEVVRDGARYLEGQAAGEDFLVHVHRSEDIAKNTGGDARKALRQALGALEEDPSQLETLLKVTEKVIFDSDDIVRATPPRPTPEQAQSTEAVPVPSSLALVATGRRSARRRQSLASGDLVILLDALMRRLGEGLSTNSVPRPRNDQDEIGADDEDGGELARQAADFETLAKACRAKVRRLITRLEGQFKLATPPDRARRCIVQLAAVLGVVRALRLVGQRPEWRKTHLELVARDDQHRLFRAAVVSAVWGEGSLVPRALTETDGEWFDELSMVLGLLTWLAWDVGIDAAEAENRDGQRGVLDETWSEIQLLGVLGPWLQGDENAFTILCESIARTPRVGIDSDHWISWHCGLMEAFAEATAKPDHVGQLGRRPRPGNLVILNSREPSRVRVVLDVRPVSGDVNVVIFDPAEAEGKRIFRGSRVATLAWEPLASKKTAST